MSSFLNRGLQSLKSSWFANWLSNPITEMETQPTHSFISPFSIDYINRSEFSLLGRQPIWIQTQRCIQTICLFRTAAILLPLFFFFFKIWRSSFLLLWEDNSGVMRCANVLSYSILFYSSFFTTHPSLSVCLSLSLSFSLLTVQQLLLSPPFSIHSHMHSVSIPLSSLICP